MTTVNQPQSSTKSNLFSFKNGALTVGLALTMLLSSCGKKTEQKLNDHDIRLGQTEQVDSLQNVWLQEQGNDITKIRKILEAHDIKFEEIDTLNKAQTEKITKLYEENSEFKAEMDKLNECCNAGKTQETPKKKPVAKKPTIQQEVSPTDTTKTVKEWPKGDGEAISF